VLWPLFSLARTDRLPLSWPLLPLLTVGHYLLLMPHASAFVRLPNCGFNWTPSIYILYSIYIWDTALHICLVGSVQFAIRAHFSGCFECQSSNGGSATQVKWIRCPGYHSIPCHTIHTIPIPSSCLRFSGPMCVPCEYFAWFAPHLFVCFGTRLFVLPFGPTFLPRTRTTTNASLDPKDLQPPHVRVHVCVWASLSSCVCPTAALAAVS